MRRVAALAAIASIAISGCSLEGTSTDSVRFSDDAVPFTFSLPPEFTDESVDDLNSRGDVVAVRALDKVNAIAVRRLGAGARTGTSRIEILGKQVTSRVYRVRAGWGLECQYTQDRRDDVLDACRQARRTLSLR